MNDAVEGKLTSWSINKDGEIRMGFVFHRDDADKIDPMRKMVGHAFGIAFAHIDGMSRDVGSMRVPARSHNEGTAALAPRQITPGGGSLLDNDNAASGPHKPSPGRSPAQRAFLLCNQPSGRLFLEERRRHAIPGDNHINTVDEAKHVLRAWLQVESLSELDRDPAAGDRWKDVNEDYKKWLAAAVYVETPRI